MTKKQIKRREEKRKAVNERTMKQLEAFQSENRYAALKRYFERRNISTMAIYGGGQVGRKFSWICKKSNMIPEYIIDKFVSGEMDGVPVYQFRSVFLPEVDAVIIVPCHEKEFIKFEIMNYFTDSCRLIGIDDLLREMEEM